MGGRKREQILDACADAELYREEDDSGMWMLCRAEGDEMVIFARRSLVGYHTRFRSGETHRHGAALHCPVSLAGASVLAPAIWLPGPELTSRAPEARL